MRSMIFYFKISMNFNHPLLIYWNFDKCVKSRHNKSTGQIESENWEAWKCSDRTDFSDVRNSFTGNEKVQLNAGLFDTDQEDNKIEDKFYDETLGMTN